MEYFEVENKQTTMKSSNNRLHYVIMGSNLVLNVAAVSLIAYVVLNASGPEEGISKKDLELEKTLLSPFFLSLEELEELKKRTQRWIPVEARIGNETIEQTNNSTLNVENDIDWIPVDYVAHICCASKQKFYRPLNGIITDINNNTRLLATYKNKFQYFPTEECFSVGNMNGAQCEQQQAFYDAVYVKDNGEGFGIAKFLHPNGCCKCVNRAAIYP